MTEVEKSFQRENMIYQVVASRRLQWDYLLWQVPVLSLTAQAFLFTIAVGGASSQFARIVSSLLAMVITFLCLTLMARHREAEIHDAHWLEDFEEDEWGSDPRQRFRIHGEAFARKRPELGIYGGWTERIVAPLPGRKTLPGFKTWVLGLLCFGIAAFTVLVVSIFAPEAFLAPQQPSGPASLSVTGRSYPLSDAECEWDYWCR
ncbi:hypothetical protein [Mycobacterium sp.]|uniref:hypothetical protein n=1 Tax=Mycobacterium sp. TaxID=1785 RepID=UPI003D0A3F50